MLLGSLVQAGSFFKFDGPVDDVGASPGTSRGFVTGLFEETGFAAEIDDQRISTEADVELLIQRSATHRIVLFGAVSSFGDGLLADHAAPLTTAITKKDDGYTFRFWSSGLKDTPPLSERDLRYDSKEILRRKFNGFISVKYK